MLHRHDPDIGSGDFDYNRRVEYIIPHKEVEAGKCVRYIEVSANGMFGAGPQDDVRVSHTPPPDICRMQG